MPNFNQTQTSHRLSLIYLWFFSGAASAIAHAQDTGGASSIAAAFSQLFGVLALGALVCLIVGWKQPEQFRFVFKERTTAPMVRGTFGAALLVFGWMGSSLEPRPQVSPSERSAQAAQARAEVKRKEAEEKARLAETRAQEAEQKAKVAEKAAREAKAQGGGASDESPSDESPSDKSPSNESGESENKGVGASLKSFLSGLTNFQQISPAVGYNIDGVTVGNRDSFVWRDVVISLNPTNGSFGGYEYRVREFHPGEEMVIPFHQFATKRGERLVIAQTKLLRYAIRCRVDDGTGGAMGEWRLGGEG